MSGLVGTLRRAVNRALIAQVPRDHLQSDREFRRRRIVVAVTLVLGAILLGVSLRVRPGDPAFYVLTTLLAATWLAGGLISGPLHLGHIPFRDRLRRPVVTPLVIGLLLAAVFVAGAFVIRELPVLRDYVTVVLNYATYGNLLLVAIITVINGVAEEIFFRGGLYAALGRTYPVAISTAIYALATAATGNPMLLFAAIVVGWVLGLQRRASGGVLAPVITHITWSMTMLFALPLLVPA